jgi:predicted dehydrogenase
MIQIAIAGCGNIGSHHLHSLAQLEEIGSEIDVAIISSSSGVRASLTRKFR